jgi:hypothetical protein
MIKKLKGGLIKKGYNDFIIENDVLIYPRPIISVNGVKRYNDELLIVAIHKHGLKSVIESMYNNKIILCL